MSILTHMHAHMLNRRAKIAELTASIQRQEGTLKSLALPDGGAQLRARIDQQRRLLAALTGEGEGETVRLSSPAGQIHAWHTELSTIQTFSSSSAVELTTATRFDECSSQTINFWSIALLWQEQASRRPRAVSEWQGT